MASSSSMVRNEARINHLQKFHSKVPSSLLETLYDKYDIHRVFALTVPACTQAVFDHSNNIALVYLKHFEYELRLPLHPFLRRVFEALRVSPSQRKPNSIVTLVGFIVICCWLGVEPTLRVLGHLVCVKVNQQEGHYYLQILGGNKIVSNAPESNKDWKERFVWIFIGDAILGCSMWPEINKDVLRPGLLSSDEKPALDKIRAYTGSRQSENLFDNSVLRVVSMSSVPPSTKDEARSAMLTLGSEEIEMLLAAPPARTQGGPSVRPKKCLRLDLAPEEAERVQANAAKIAARLAGLVLLQSRPRGLKRNRGD